MTQSGRAHGTHAHTHSRVVEVVRNEGGALEEAEDISWQRALEAASVNPGSILFGQSQSNARRARAALRAWWVCGYAPSTNHPPRGPTHGKIGPRNVRQVL